MSEPEDWPDFLQIGPSDDFVRRYVIGEPEARNVAPFAAERRARIVEILGLPDPDPLSIVERLEWMVTRVAWYRRHNATTVPKKDYRRAIRSADVAAARLIAAIDLIGNPLFAHFLPEWERAADRFPGDVVYLPTGIDRPIRGVYGTPSDHVLYLKRLRRMLRGLRATAAKLAPGRGRPPEDWDRLLIEGCIEAYWRAHRELPVVRKLEDQTRYGDIIELVSEVCGEPHPGLTEKATRARRRSAKRAPKGTRNRTNLMP